MKTWRRDWHELTGSYALDALDPPEAAGFERHLVKCGRCATEIRGLRETAARLAIAATVAPPARIRERALAATRRTRQLPPLTAAQPRELARRPRPSLVVAAVGIAAVIVLAVTLAVTRQQLNTAQNRDRAIAAILAAPDARVRTARTTAGATVTMVASESLRAAIVAAAGLPPLPATLSYQAWVLDPAGARSAGLLAAASGGRTDPVLAAGTRPGDLIGITVEPAGGTERPTTTPVITMALPA